MNEVFSPKRFWHLLIKTTTEHRQEILITLGLAILLTPLLYPSVSLDKKGSSTFLGEYPQSFAFIGVLFLCGSYLVSILMAKFSNRAKGYYFLTLPASNVEKIAVVFVLVGLFFPILFVAYFKVLDIQFVAKFHASLDPKSEFYAKNYSKLVDFPVFSSFMLKKIGIYLACVGFLATSLTFSNENEYARVKVVGIFFLTIWLTRYVHSKSLVYFFGHKQPFYQLPFSNEMRLPETINAITFIKLETADTFWLDIAIYCVLPALLWLAAFARLREKEY